MGVKLSILHICLVVCGCTDTPNHQQNKANIVVNEFTYKQEVEVVSGFYVGEEGTIQEQKQVLVEIFGDRETRYVVRIEDEVALFIDFKPEELKAKN